MRKFKGLVYKQNNSGGYFVDVKELNKQNGVVPVSIISDISELNTHILVLDENLKFDNIQVIQDTKNDWCYCCGKRWNSFPSIKEITIFENTEEVKEYQKDKNLFENCYFYILAEDLDNEKKRLEKVFKELKTNIEKLYKQ